MTVSYQYDVASSASGGFIRLLFRWKGSVWKVVYREMLIFTLSYITLTILYQFALSESQQKIFERIVIFCSTFMDLIPLSFMLGFYVSFIAARWWSQFVAIPWPDKLMNIIAMYIPGFDEDSRVVRRTLMRYLNLSLVLVLRSISMAVKRRFPTKEHLIEAGFMTKTELEMFQSVPSTEFNTFWIPCTWFINVLRAARQECRITDSNGLKLIMEELNEFRSKCGLLWGYDWISIPLVYTQVVTMATYAFYVACMFGRQNVNVSTEKGSLPVIHRYDYYIPIFTILQLMFYMGLLKVAEQLINPFGDDDEDFELNWIIDRHMKVSYLGVDTLNSEPPPLVKDTYYNELDVKIPYTEASKSYKKKTYRGSVAYMQVPMEGQGMVVPDMSEDEDDGETVSENMGPRRPSVYTLFGGKGSYTNLDNRSISSVDSDWKSSLPNLATAKNASGTLGDFEQEEVESDEHSSPDLHKCNQGGPFVVDMAKAEDDEIVLQEVIIDKSDLQKPLVQRSDSLQIPGALPKLKEPTTAFSILRGLSPKIAPKFPREKLKSMFRKRRLSSAFPFYKLKGVSFSRDTKNDESINRSLLDVSYQEPVEVEITLSTPELTEIEKETGVHPYYYTQQTITSAKQLATDKALIIHQPILEPSNIEKERLQAIQMGKFLVRSNSLPNISHPDDYARYMQDPAITCSLKKISEIIKRKQKSQTVKVKKKSSPPNRIGEESSGDTQESESPSDTEPMSRRSTLPEITVTKCEPKASAHLDLATQSSNSGHSCDRVSDTRTEKSPPKTETAQQKYAQQSPHSSQQDLERVSGKPEKVESAPKPHSIPKKPRMPSPPCADIMEPELSKSDSSKPLPRKRSPPPKRPGKLMFPKAATKKIAGISLKNVPASPSFDSAPTSPVSAIPSSSSIGRAPFFPESQKKTVKPSESPKRSPTSDVPKHPVPSVPRTRADTVINISDSTEDLTEVADQSHPPEPPQRHIPRTSSKGKK